jgi:1-acyl-sn-glycerol-3-phosphate acyltransferase
VCNHASYLDAPALMVVDPYPDATFLALASLFKAPLVGAVLRAWDVIPVDRRGRDTGSVSALLRALRAGRVVGVAPEGVRSSDGHLGKIHPVLAAIAAGAGVPVVPIGIAGTQIALPRGRLFPRRHKIVVRIGTPLMLARGTKADHAARAIREAIAALLPPEQQPLPTAEAEDKPV